MTAPSRDDIWPVGMYAPGNYWCTCVSCGQTFTGDKRAKECPQCVIRALLAQRERDEEVIEGVLIGGNHLALHLPVPCPPYQTPPLEALEEIGSGVQYDIWCCWRSIMQLRDALAARDAGGE